MELKMIKQEDMDRLLANIDSNIGNKNYSKNESWLKEWLAESDCINLGITVPNITLNPPIEKSTDTDYINAKKLYDALKGISIELATDNRFWCYLTHEVFWSYMIKRWPLDDLEDKKLITRISDRYLMKNSSDKALLRNQLSRMWWMAHTTYDENLINPYEYTEFLLNNSDFQVGLMERAFSRNSDLTKKVVKAIKRYSEEYSYPNNKKIRVFLKELNGLGGVKVLDLLDDEYIYNFTVNILNML